MFPRCFWLTIRLRSQAQLTPEPLRAKLFNLAFKALGLLDRISGGHERVGTLIWLNGSAECAIVNFADVVPHSI